MGSVRQMLIAAVLSTLLLTTTAVHAQSALWDSSSVGGWSAAEEADWRDNQPAHSSVASLKQAAYDWCETTSQYQIPGLDCTPHPLFEDSVTWYNFGSPEFSFWIAVIQVYRKSGKHGSIYAQWYPYYTTEADCPTGEVIGPEGHDCIVPDHYVDTPSQTCPLVTNNPSNPCDPSNGNKSQMETDYVGGGLAFRRYYNSRGAYRTGAGMAVGWRHTYSRAIDERPDRKAASVFASPVSESSSYSTAATACTSGWADIKGDLWAGDLSTATATFSGGNTCKIESGGSTVAYLPVRGRYQWTGFAGPATVKTVTRASGASIVFELAGTDWVSALNPRVSLVTSGTDWIFTDENDTEETYDSSGRLKTITYRNGLSETLEYELTGGDYDGDSTTLDRVTGQYGHFIEFEYSNGGLYQIYTPGGAVRYYYAAGNLSSVRNQRYKYRTYKYEIPELPNHLTGIIDENNDRYATWDYDNAGRAISSEHAGGKEKVLFAYNANGTTTLTMANGASRDYVYTVEQGTRKLEGLTGDVCSTCPGGNISDRTYDSNGFLDEATDWNGNVTRTTRNSRGLTETLTEGLGSTEQRLTTTIWHANYRLPTKVTSPKNVTDYVYDTDGNPTSITVSSGSLSRAWAVTYDSDGRPLTVDGPRTDVSDVTTFVYHACTSGGKCGRLYRVINALGQTRSFSSYDGAVRPTKIWTNGVPTWYTYDARGNLLTVRVAPTGGPDRTTTMTYDNADQLATLATPDGMVLTYAYDAAHYLISVTDNLGNKIEYDYDAMGSLIDGDTYDSGATLKRAIDYAYDLNRRLDSVTNGGFVTDLSMDDVGNLTGETDPKLAATAHLYDALNRLEQSTDALSGVINYGYDAHDNVTSVTAANGAITTYEYDDLDNLTKEISADRGTVTYTYDEAGNRKTATDARGKVTTYAYDALNRLTLTTFDDLGTIAYEYDVGANAMGLLNKMTDASGNTIWSYNSFGEVRAKTQTIGAVALTTSYAYDSSGRLSTMTLPSGKVVTYGYNSYLANSVTVDTTTILSAASYDPFGPVNGWTWGNSATSSRAYDLRGLMTSHGVASDTRTLGYDSTGLLNSLTDLRHTDTYDYDVLWRLDDYDHAGTAPLPTTQDFTHDANGNRASINENGTPYSYTNQSSSNRLLGTVGPTAKTYTYDATGNATADGIHTYVYDDRGRLVSVDLGTTTYEHNGQGQRVKKNNGTISLFAYDEAGQLVGEYDSLGNAVQEHVWFNGAPVAVLVGSSTHYVHTDQLGTPRAITDGNTVIWRWESDPFGSTAAQEDPDANSTLFAYNLRFPGQYYDSETGLHYNYFRTYDPSTGRYMESDPIGLQGGLNTYGYVGGNPLSGIDPLGLYEGDGQFPGPDPGAAAAAMAREAAAAQRLFEEYQRRCRDIGYSNCDQPQQGPFNESSSFIGDACDILGATVGLYTAGQGLPMSRLLPPRNYTPAFPPNPGQVQHIFRNRPGHIADTPSNRQLLQNVASNPANRVGTDKYGTTWWFRYRSDGSQVWARTRGGVIQNGGVNPAPPLPPGM